MKPAQLRKTESAAAALIGIGRFNLIHALHADQPIALGICLLCIGAVLFGKARRKGAESDEQPTR